MIYPGSKLIDWGQKASFEFFSSDIPLEETIVKIASDNDLTPEQIKRVCQTANKETMIQIYKAAGDQTQEFDLASPDTVIEKMGDCKQPCDPVSSDYSSPPPSLATSEIKVANNFFDGVKPWEKRARYFEIEKLASSLELELKAAEQQNFMQKVAFGDLKKRLAEAIKQAVAKGHDIKELMAAAMAAIPGKTAKVKEYMKEALNSLGSKGSSLLGSVWSGIKGLFKGGEAVDDRLISKALQDANGKVPLKVINGDQRYFGLLRTIYDTDKSILDSDRLAGDIRNKLTVVRKELNAAKPAEGEWF